MNKVDLIGRVATKIEVKESKNKKKYVRFRIAVNSFNGREETTTFLSVITWSKSTVDFLEKFVSIGDLIFLIKQKKKIFHSKEKRYIVKIYLFILLLKVL